MTKDYGCHGDKAADEHLERDPPNGDQTPWGPLTDKIYLTFGMNE